MLLDLLNYTSIADKIVISEFQKAEKPMPDAEALFSHVLNAQRIWAARLKNQPLELDRFDIHASGDFEQMHKENMEALLEVYHTHDLTAQVIYHNSAGESFVNIAHDILFQVINHSTYHRAQVVSMLKAHGIKPPVTDYIFLKREGML